MTMRSTRLLRLLYGMVIVGVTVVDQITKTWAQHFLNRIEPFDIIPGFFRLVLVHNRGALFGFFQEIISPLRTVLFLLLPAVVIAVLVWLSWRTAAIDHRSQWAFALILGGAFGNLIDRMRLGHVIDFLDVYVRLDAEHHWPAFNVADSCICIGIALLVVDTWKTRQSIPAGEEHVSNSV